MLSTPSAAMLAGISFKYFLDNPSTRDKISVFKGMDLKPKLQRWREPFVKHIAKLSAHTERFIMAKGKVNHFTRFTPELMRKTISLKKQLDEFKAEYVEWIKINVDKNPERYIT